MKVDSNWVWAIAINEALKGNTSLIEKLKQEAIELWNGDGI